MRHPSPTVIARGPRGWVWCVRMQYAYPGGRGFIAGVVYGLAPLPSRPEAVMHALHALTGAAGGCCFIVGGGA